MSFLVILCEGYTELDFVRDVLDTHLLGHGVKVHPILFGKKIKHDIADAPGGVLEYDIVYRHIQAALRQYSADSSRVTTMFDLYAFPTDFPDYDVHVKMADPYERVAALENAMKHHVGGSRFIPNIQLHEFEALVFVKPEEILGEFPHEDSWIGLAGLLNDIWQLKPEEINQTKEGAPSKRIKRFFRGYNKRTMGPSITRRIGLERLKEACPHFGAWLSTLEALGTK